MNPFHRSLEQFRGKRVTAISNNGRVVTGWVERVHHNDRHLVLQGSHKGEGAQGEFIGTAFLSHVDEIYQNPPDSRYPDAGRHHVALIDVHAVNPSPLHVREFEREGNEDYIREVQDDGWTGSYPVVRETDEGYELIAGHKRMWIARQAGLQSHPAKVVAASAWEAQRRFLYDHLPCSDTDDTVYTAEEARQCIQLLKQRGVESFLELNPVVYNAERLQIQL